MRFSRNRLLQLLVDAFVVFLALTLAYAIRFEGPPPPHYQRQFLLVLPYLILVRLLVFGGFAVYKLIWRYVAFRDLPRIAMATLCGSLFLVATRFLASPLAGLAGLHIDPGHVTVPWGVMTAEFVLTSVGIVVVRALWRFRKEEARRKGSGGSGLAANRRALLLGAGSAGVMVAREVSTNPELGFQVVGFLDDDRNKHGTIIHGFKVLGATDQLPDLARTLNADLAVITIGNAPASAVRRIVGLAERRRMKVQIIPELNEILSGRVAVSKVRDVAIEDLLRRAPVELEEGLIQRFITHKIVLVTGAGGSIGSEICRQVCRFEPRRLILLDQAENPLFHIHRELREKFPAVELVPFVGSVTDGMRMRQVLHESTPEVIFHAAAHKHVPLMEANSGEAIRNNVGGSRQMADLASEFGVEAFVMISTDKAVNPTSVMGATKRLAEIYVQATAARSETRMITVRFGNVLDSEGSVVPVFREQIAKGGPITVTHPEMKRYFMTIPEASQLVLQASAMGNGGEIFVLEMGEAIPIVGLARDLIRLSGFVPDDDIEIAYTGIRPGEKLSEEINLSEENATKTRHPRVWIGKSVASDPERIAGTVDRLLAQADRAADEVLRRELAAAIPEYTPTVPSAPGPSSDPSRPSDSKPEETSAPKAEGDALPNSA